MVAKREKDIVRFDQRQREQTSLRGEASVHRLHRLRERGWNMFHPMASGMEGAA